MPFCKGCGVTQADAPKCPICGTSFVEEPVEEAPEPVEVVTSTDYSSWTVAELKEELRERGLSISGRKAELIDRLEE